MTYRCHSKPLPSCKIISYARSSCLTFFFFIQSGNRHCLHINDCRAINLNLHSNQRLESNTMFREQHHVTAQIGQGALTFAVFEHNMTASDGKLLLLASAGHVMVNFFCMHELVVRWNINLHAWAGHLMMLLWTNPNTSSKLCKAHIWRLLTVLLKDKHRKIMANLLAVNDLFLLPVTPKVDAFKTQAILLILMSCA